MSDTVADTVSIHIRTFHGRTLHRTARLTTEWKLDITAFRHRHFINSSITTSSSSRHHKIIDSSQQAYIYVYRQDSNIQKM